MGVITVKDLVKTYGHGDSKVNAVNGVSLQIENGDFYSIIGPSGSGKTTLLNIMGGLEKPTSGNVSINNTDIYSLSDQKLSAFRRRNIGFVFQFFNLLPVLTVEENILLPTRLDNKRVDSNYLGEILNFLGIYDKRKRYPATMSGGQQQRVAIARALYAKPAFILADEPTGNLDKKTSCEVMELLAVSSKQLKQTMIVITHDIEIANNAKYVINIIDGKISGIFKGATI